jgi:hypothetical protein
MRFAPFFLFLTLGLFLYFPIFFAGFAGDDMPHFHVVQKHYSENILSPFVHVIGTPTDNHLLGYFYRPLPFFFYALISHFTANTNAFPFHALQVILYVFSSYLFFLFCNQFFARKISLVLGLIFLIHPANNDLGAYIAALDETLCLFFGLLALLSLRKKPSMLNIGLAAAALLLSLFSKETGILFVAIAVIYALYKKSFAYILPLLSSLIMYLFFRINATAHPVYALTASPTANISPSQHISLAPQIAFTFLREIVMPTRAGIKADAFSFTWQSSIFPTIIFLAFLLACIGIWMYLRQHKSNKTTLWGLFFIWFLLGIPLHLQFIPLEVIFADRWLYFTEMGILGMLGVGLSFLPKTTTNWLKICRILFITLLCVYAIETIVLNFMWLEWERYFI